MKNWILAGLIFSLFMSVLCIKDIYAETPGVFSWVEDNYVGVGAIDMQRMPERKIYKDLMTFFLTDPDAKAALEALKNVGLTDKVLRRIIVGIPADVDKAEFIVFWDTKEPLEKYRPVLDQYAGALTSHKFADSTYYCTKKSNLCLTVFDDGVALASESKLKAAIEARGGKRKITLNTPLLDKATSTDQKHDSWMAFSLDKVEKMRIGQGDPLIDMTKEGKGKLKLGALSSGNVVIDFLNGLNVSILLEMDTAADAKSFADILNYLLVQARADDDVKTLGLVEVIDGVNISAEHAKVRIKVKYDDKTFDSLIDIVTDLVKSVAHSAK